MNIQEVNKSVYDYCRSLGLQHVVGSSGAVNSHIAIIAEAPGEREVNMKIPLCGGSGKLLWDALRKFDLNRQQVYVTNIVKRPLITKLNAEAKGTSVSQKIAKDELILWEQVLNYELSLLPNCSIIVVLGDMALSAISSLKGIHRWRGSIIQHHRLRLASSSDLRTYCLVCINNPAAAMHDPREEVIFRFHIGKLNRLLQGKFKPHTVDISRINPDYKTAIEWIDSYHKEAINHGTPISIDIETPNNELGCVGLSTSSNSGCCINLRHLSIHSFTLEEELNILQRLQQLLIDHRVRFIAQNGLFDMTFSWFKAGLRFHSIWFDTMLAHHTLYSQLPHDLGFLVTQYTDHPYYKDDKDKWKESGDIDSHWQYNIRDCALTFAVHQHLLRELRSSRMEKFFFEHVMRLNKHLQYLIVGGVKCNTELKSKLISDLTEKLAIQLNTFHSLVKEATGLDNYMPNPLSSDQISDLLFTRLHLVGRGRSTDKDNRVAMLNHPRTSEQAKQIIYAIDDYKKESKFLSTYATMELDNDERFRCEYKQHGVASAPGRLSSATTGWEKGGNLQNIPSRAYSMFIADPGYVFGYFDLAQAEARIVGWKARIDSWIADFERARLGGNFDCHRSLAALMYGVPYDEVPEKDEDAEGNRSIRWYAKRSRHGFNYRLGPETFSIKNNLPLAKSSELHSIYLRTNPELVRWWENVERTVHDKRVLFNAYGRRLIFLSHIQQSDIQTAIAFYPQSTCGDHVCRVIYLTHDDPKWPANARICLNNHDALIVLAPERKILTCLSIMKRYAEQPINIDGMPLIIPADCKISVADNNGVHSWASLKKVEL